MDTTFLLRFLGFLGFLDGFLPLPGFLPLLCLLGLLPLLCFLTPLGGLSLLGLPPGETPLGIRPGVGLSTGASTGVTSLFGHSSHDSL